MLSTLSILLAAASLTASLSLPHQEAHERRQTPGMQAIPKAAKADNTFSNGGVFDFKGAHSWQDGNDPGVPPPIYGPRDIDLPFYRLYHGNMKLFQQDQLNSDDYISDNWKGAPEGGSPGTGYDSANQSACGIPNNAFFDSHVAIHPYFLKYAGLDRKFSLVYQAQSASSGICVTRRLVDTIFLCQVTACKTSVSPSGETTAQPT